MSSPSKRGSVLPVTMILVIAFSILALSILSLAMNTYRLSMRNSEEAKARAVAETELEALFYQTKYLTVVKSSLAKDIPNILSGLGELEVGSVPIAPTTSRTPFLKVHRDEGWRVYRSMSATSAFTGNLVGTTKIGTFTNIDVRVTVRPPVGSPWEKTVSVSYGRLFVASQATEFQHIIFFQGDLEMSPSGTLTYIHGDVAANGSIFMGAKGSGVLKLDGNVFYLADHGFNLNAGVDTIFHTADDSQSTVKPGTYGFIQGLALTPPVFDGVGGQAAQLKTLTKPENLFGSADPTAIAANNTQLFPNGINDVYRSLLVPPPSQGGANEYSASGLTDDPTVSALRAYNQAGMIINVNAAANTVTVQFRQPDGSLSAAAAPPAGLIKQYNSGSANTTTVYDQREGRNVTMTDLDFDVLNTVVGKSTPNATFNGVLYVNQLTGDSGNPTAVRLLNAATTPQTYNSQDGDYTNGFSVATNGGIYVKGSYNTTKVNDKDGNPVVAPSMLMGDAVTVLSDAWDDAKAQLDIDQRIAESRKPDGTPRPDLATDINAGILTGNVSATADNESGGAQNLVRYLENWTTNAQTINYTGSLGRLFDSKMFTRPFMGPDRADFYDPSFLSRSPPGSPHTSDVSPGRFFGWSVGANGSLVTF